MPIGDTPRMVDCRGSSAAGIMSTWRPSSAWFGRLGGFDSEIGWQQYLDRMAENVQKVERTATDMDQPVSAVFPPEQSDEQIVPIINSLVHDVEALYQVNIPNDGQIVKGFPEDLVIECQGVVSGAGIRAYRPRICPPSSWAGDDPAGIMPSWWSMPSARMTAICCCSICSKTRARAV